MASNISYQQSPGAVQELSPDLGAALTMKPAEPHPTGRVKYNGFVQFARMLLFVTWFNACCVNIHITQMFGAPLYFFNKDWYHAYMAITKQSFALLITTITQWFSPTVIRVSGDKSVRGQIKQNKDGRLETDFPERLIMIANHQLYTDFIYLWWIAYTNKMHGHMYIILKESLKWVPFIGPGMMFYGFVFMARNWTKDKPRLKHRLKQLKGRHSGPLSGSQDLDPMWLMIFPEGTNLSANTRKGSAKWAAKQGINDLQHQLLPRSTGFQFCLQELKGTVDWVYDCTTAYEGIPRGGYGQDYFTLRSTYFQGRPPKSVNLYWRRFPVSSIPVDDVKAFEQWVNKVWLEKEDLLEYYTQNGRFPDADEGQDLSKGADAPKGVGFIETEVRLAHWYESGSIFIFLAVYALFGNILAKVWNLAIYGTIVGATVKAAA
ncbi:hypothetical protein MMC15_005454 [Xylographa vitiligo]|nr:hypothetical protein [Xylographa vitiligo]